MIYFVSDRTHVKIGYTRTIGGAPARLATLQTGNAVGLELLAVVEGTLADEALLHECFAEHRVSGEWFEITDHLALGLKTPERADQMVREIAGYMGARALHDELDAYRAVQQP